jgi:hypothetical protein
MKIVCSRRRREEGGRREEEGGRRRENGGREEGRRGMERIKVLILILFRLNKSRINRIFGIYFHKSAPGGVAQFQCRIGYLK